MSTKTTTEVVTAMLERKRRSLARSAEKSFDITHPYDAVGKAVIVAGTQGAVEVLEELLAELAEVEPLSGTTTTQYGLLEITDEYGQRGKVVEDWTTSSFDHAQRSADTSRGRWQVVSRTVTTTTSDWTPAEATTEED